MTPEFLLFDHDGVLVDTERWYFEATRSVMRDCGLALSAAAYLECMAHGRSCWDLLDPADFDEVKLQRCRERRNALYQASLVNEDIEIDGVDEVLSELGHEYRMAIVTTARRVDFDLIHSGRSIAKHFEFVWTVEDYARAKPHPDPYLAAVAGFGCRADQALALEDTSRGLSSARAAGLECWIIESDFTASQDFSGAAEKLASIRQLPLMLARRRSPTIPSTARA